MTVINQMYYQLSINSYFSLKLTMIQGFFCFFFVMLSEHFCNILGWLVCCVLRHIDSEVIKRWHPHLLSLAKDVKLGFNTVPKPRAVPNRDSNPGPSHGSPLHNRCATPAPQHSWIINFWEHHIPCSV